MTSTSYYSFAMMCFNHYDLLPLEDPLRSLCSIIHLSALLNSRLLTAIVTGRARRTEQLR